MPGSCSGSAELPSTAALVQQHAVVFERLASPEAGALLPVALGAALELGLHHEGIAAGALGMLLAMARALHSGGARAVLAPLLSTGKPAVAGGTAVAASPAVARRAGTMRHALRQTLH